MATRRDKKPGDEIRSTALTAVALQEHLVKSLGLGDMVGPRRIGLGPAAKAAVVKNKARRPVIDTGRRKPKPKKKEEPEEKEYVLDAKQPALTLAQKMGLVDAPTPFLTEVDWKEAKEKSNQRDDSKLPCVICKEDFGTQEQVLLSCTHVFHRTCLQAFERFTGRKTCPMCRKEQYQTRVIHEGSRHHRHKCATMIQACWRGYVVRMWYFKLRETVPPKDQRLRQKFYEERLRKITDRMVRSCDFNVNQFLRDIDTNLAASRDVFRNFDAMFQQLSDEDWDRIQLKAVERGEVDCPICLTCLVDQSYIQRPKSSSVIQSQSSPVIETKGTAPKGRTSAQTALQALNTRDHQRQAKKLDKSVTRKTGSQSLCNAHSQSEAEVGNETTESAQSGCRRTVLLSCSHVFHETCLEMFEELNVEINQKTCPVCRTMYQKKVLVM